MAGGGRGRRVGRPSTRKRTAADAGLDGQDPSNVSASPSVIFDGQEALQTTSTQAVQSRVDRSHEIPLTTLSTAVEQAALQGRLTSSATHARDTPTDMSLDTSEEVRLERASEQLVPPFDGALSSLDFENSLDILAAVSWIMVLSLHTTSRLSSMPNNLYLSFLPSL